MIFNAILWRFGLLLNINMIYFKTKNGNLFHIFKGATIRKMYNSTSTLLESFCGVHSNVNTCEIKELTPLQAETSLLICDRCFKIYDK